MTMDMEQSVPLSEAKTRLSELARLAEAGQRTTITVSGRAVARLEPHGIAAGKLGSGHGWILAKRNFSVSPFNPSPSLPLPFKAEDGGTKEILDVWSAGRHESGILWRHQTDPGTALIAVPSGRWDSRWTCSYRFYFRWTTGEIMELDAWVGKMWSNNADQFNEAHDAALQMGNSALGIGG